MILSLRPKWIVAGLAVVLPLLFASFTGHAWEDYFITLRSSRNLAEGHGLVFNPGERVHTFTSPLGVLLPALCLQATGTENPMAALWLFRGFSIAALASAAWFVWRRFDRLRVGSIGRWVFFSLFLTDAKLADFATNGMETGLLVFFALLLWCELEADRAAPRATVLGVAMAGLMWTRPDGCVLIAALVLPQVLVRRSEGAGQPWPSWTKGALLAALLYLPWFAWAWWYYGSPVPHTIVAKSQSTAPPALSSLLSIPWRSLLGQSLLPDLYLPSYWFIGGWPSFLPRYGHCLTVIGAFAWLLPFVGRVARRASLSVFIGMFYVCAIVLFPWYSPPWTALCSLALALLADQLHHRFKDSGKQLPTAMLRVTVGLFVAIQGGLWMATAWQMRVQQTLIENQVRRPIGEWLRQNAAPGDTVFLEPLGYIGYYSNLKIFDYPGLSSPEVVAAIRQGSRRFAKLIGTLQPTWLVLRPSEIADRTRPENEALTHYELVARWDVQPQLDRIDFLPGRNWLERDACFELYRRMPPGRPGY